MPDATSTLRRISALLERAHLHVLPRQRRQMRANGAQVVVWMDPRDFLRLTTGTADMAWIEQSAKDLDDYNRWSREGEILVPPFLRIRVGYRIGGKVVSHEGRHRALALARKGGRRMAVHLVLKPDTADGEFMDDLRARVPEGSYDEPESYLRWGDVPTYVQGQGRGDVLLRSDMRLVRDRANHTRR